MKIIDNIDLLIGNTPLFELKNVCAELGISSKIYAKLEKFNPAGSIKDRTAKFMIDDAEKKGKLKKGGTIIEPTSGNTGIGLAMLGVARGYRVILTMPNTMSEERKSLLSAYGAELVLTDGALGMAGAIKKAEELKKEIDGSIICDQFSNKANVFAHYNTTGPEIWFDTEGNIDCFIAGIGTGGTLTGTAKFLKEKNENVTTIGVEPKSSPLISEGKSGGHKIQGIGANFIPENYNSSVCDKVVAVSDEDAYALTKLVAKKEGLLVGISSGAALKVAIDYAKEKGNENKKIVVIFPDSGERYISTKVFD